MHMQNAPSVPRTRHFLWGLPVPGSATPRGTTSTSTSPATTVRPVVHHRAMSAGQVARRWKRRRWMPGRPQRGVGRMVDGLKGWRVEGLVSATNKDDRYCWWFRKSGVHSPVEVWGAEIPLFLGFQKHPKWLFGDFSHQQYRLEITRERWGFW